MRNIGVYKTNVKDRSNAKLIIEAIHNYLPGSDISFDLEDCDRVLRVVNHIEEIDDNKVRTILEMFGFEIENMI